MPVYQYEGVHYELPDGLSNEQAIAKIEAHLGKAPKQPEAPKSNVNQIPGMENSVDPTKPPEEHLSLYDSAKKALNYGVRTAAGIIMSPMDPKGQMDTPDTKAAKENAAMLATGAVAQAGAPVAAGLQWLNDKGAGRDTNFERDYFGNMDSMTFHPKSEVGQEWGGEVGDFMNRYLMPLAGHVSSAHVPPERVKVPKAPLAEAEKVKTLTPDQKVAKLFEDEDAASSSAVDRPQPLAEAQPSGSLPHTEWAAQVDDPFAQMKRQLDTPQEFPAETKAPVLDKMASELQYSTPEARSAQKMLEDRQAQLEFEMKQRTHLEQGARMRKEQEAAPTGFKEWVDNHPSVKAAEESVRRQEKLIEKVADKDQAERHLAMLKDDLEQLRKELEQNPTRPFNIRKQGGGILANFANKTDTLSRLVQEGVLKPLGDSLQGVKVYRAIADGESLQGPRKAGSWVTPNRDIALNVYAKGNAARVVEDYIPKRDLYEAHPDGWVYAPKGTDVANIKRTDSLKFGEMLPSLKKQVPNKQRGAVLLDPKRRNEAGILSTIPGIKKALPTFVFKETTPADVIAMAKGAKDLDQNGVQKMFNLFTKGGQFMAEKVKNPVVNFVVDRINRQDRLARADIRDYVHDRLGNATRELSKQEKSEVWNVVNLGDLHQKELSLEQLAEAGFNEKQLNYFKEHREVMNYAFEKLNQAREVAGKKPIDKRVAYAAMRSTGDFRKLVYDADKNIVGIISSNFRNRLGKLTKDMEAKGFTTGEERYYGGQRDRKGSANEAFMSAVEWISENDSRAADFLQVLDDIRTSEVYGYLNAKSHTKGKKGIFGMEGRKTWEDAQRNAEEGMQAQLDYAERAIKWGHISEAASQIHEVLRSEEVNMPQAKAWSEKYLYNALGFNPSEIGRSIENGVAAGFKSMGVGYTAARHTMAWSRRVVNATLLGLNPAFWTTQAIQPFQAMPGLKASLIAKGLRADFDLGTGYAYLGKGAITALKERVGKPDAFEQAAYKYARENHVYGSDLVEHSNRASKDATYMFDKASNFMTGNLENATRRAVFFGIAHMLKENGMSVKNGLFEAAHTLTDQQMVNYSAIERPQLYNTLGPIGDLAVNLQNYKHNSLSRIAMFARQVAEDKSARPLAVDMAATVAMAGTLGFMGYEEADALYKFITSKLGKPDSLTSRILRMSEDAGNSVNKFTGAKEDTVGDARHILSHGGFSMLGVDMSKRLGMSNLLPNDTNEFLFPGGSKLAAMAGATWNAATNPTSMNAKRMAREYAPGAATGTMDREWFSKEIGNNELGVNKQNLQGQVRRTDLDKKWKSAGFTGIHESVEKTKNWELKERKQTLQAMRKKPLDNMRDSVYETGKINPSDVKAYLAAEGDVNTIEADMSRFFTEQSMDAKSRELMKTMASQSVANMKQAQRYMEMFRK